MLKRGGLGKRHVRERLWRQYRMRAEGFAAKDYARAAHTRSRARYCGATNLKRVPDRFPTARPSVAAPLSLLTWLPGWSAGHYALSILILEYHHSPLFWQAQPFRCLMTPCIAALAAA